MNNSKILNLIVAFICLASFIWLLKVFQLGSYPDFMTQYNVPKMIISGQNPYTGGNNLFTPQVYPPSVFFLFLPISFLSLSLASYLYVFLSIFALIVSLYLLSQIFEFKFFGISNLIMMTLVFLSFPVKFTLGMGQINIFILLIMVLALWFLKKKRDFISGIFLGLSIVIKFFPLFLPVYLLIKFKKGNRGMALPWTRLKIWYKKKQLREDLEMIDGIFLVIAIVGLLIIFFIPKEIYLQFFFQTIPSLLSSWKTDYYNQALSGLVSRSFGIGYLALVIKTVVSLSITVITLSILTKNENTNFIYTALKFSILITLSLAVNTFSWQHHFVWLIIPFYSTIYFLRKAKAGKIYFVVLVILYLLVSLNLKYPNNAFVVLQSHVLFGTVLLLALNLYMITKMQLANNED